MEAAIAALHGDTGNFVLSSEAPPAVHHHSLSFQI
jgi:hypothetical protein